MKLVIEIRRHGDELDAQHLVFTHFPISVGRGMDNDVILNDPYVSPHHLMIEYDGENLIARDNGSENGFTINNQLYTGHRALLRSGDALHLGQAEIRVFRPDHQVAPTIVLQKDNPIFKWVAHPLNVWACFLLALGMSLGWAWLEIWSEEEGLALAGAAAGTAAVIILWSAAWSVGGRLTRHKAHFKSHTALICLYIIAGTVAWYIEVYTDFLTNENWFSQVATYGLNFILLGFLLYGSLKLSTRMQPQRRRNMAAFFSFAVMAGVYIFSVVGAKNFSQQPLYPATLEPFLARLAPADTIDKFMAGNDKLFASDEFSQTNAPVIIQAKR